METKGKTEYVNVVCNFGNSHHICRSRIDLFKWQGSQIWIYEDCLTGNGNNAQCRKTAGFVLILLIFAALSLTINLVNAVVCLLHFVCIWLLCDLVFYLVTN